MERAMNGHARKGAQPGPRRRVGVIFGGRSGEHDVSLRSAQTVMQALQAAGHQVVPIGISRDGGWLTEGDPMRVLQEASPLFALTAGGKSEQGQVVKEAE